MIHELKTLDEFMDDIATGVKSFEVRIDDRNYREGDTLILRGFDGANYNDKTIWAIVTYILYGGKFGLEEGAVAMAIKVIDCNYMSVNISFTKQEAIALMKSGQKLTHRYFADEEYITIGHAGNICTEEGYTCSLDEFWSDRTDPTWQIGWEIFNLKK
jgi:ASC-1-like (ASCH) protein